MALFQKSVTNKYLKNLDTDKVNRAYENFQKFYGNAKRLANIMQLKEENYQEGFLREVFVQTLGYTINPDENYNLTTEFKNQKDSRKADGAIIRNGKAIGVIELKSTKTKDLESIKEQAFGYKNNQPDCKYVITSNFQSLRLYVDNATEYEEFDLFGLSKERFTLLFMLLSQESIFTDLPDKLKQETKFHEEKISAQLYSDYKQFKDKIFNNLVNKNPQYDKLTLFKKSQKLLDRFLFVLFAEDGGLIPPNAVSKIIEQWKDLKELDEYKPLYSRFQKLFSHLDKGHVYKKWGEIPAYNGGLFRNDEILDNSETVIDDAVLEKDSLKLSRYDFSTEVDVNILGHIFEHSLNEIEEITAELEGEPTDKKQSKRKKDGVFYTPKYITKYIVENTVGKLCDEKKAELQINNLLIDDNYHKKDGTPNQKGKQLFDTLNAYKDWLLTLKILDPACGSGAFLNATLDFLIAEHKQADDKIAELTGESIRMFDTDKSILENNIYGVDINEESVEIAKLSLWLRTAQRGRLLSDLSGNIKCGNSLIDDPEVAGEKAFNWEKEFPHVFNPDVKEKVYQKMSESKPDYVKLVKEKSKEAQQKAEQAAKLSKEALEISKQVYRYAEKITSVQEPSVPYGIKKGGFDVILGNPPYGAKISKNEFNFYTKKYETAHYKLDSFSLFFEKSLKLAKQGAEIGLIVPYTWLTIQQHSKLRKFVLSYKLLQIIDLPTKIFADADLDTVISIVKKEKGTDTIKIGKIENEEISLNEEISFDSIKKTKDFQINVNLLNIDYKILDKIKSKSIKLSDWYDVSQGLIPYDKYRGHSEFQVKNRVWHSTYKKDDTYKKELKGADISRYTIEWNGNLWISYGDWLAAPRKKEYFTSPRILIMEVTRGDKYVLKSCYVEKEYYNTPSIINIIDRENNQADLKYLLALMNSSLLSWYHKKVHPKANAVTSIPKILVTDVRNLPVKAISKEAQHAFIEKADLMLSLNKALQTEKSNFINSLKEDKGVEKITRVIENFNELEYDAFKKELLKQKVKISLGNENNEWREYFNTTKQKVNELQSQINQTDIEIDKMVYELYELTAEEIEIVENSTK